MLVLLADHDLETFEQLDSCWVGRLIDLLLDELLDILGKPGEEAPLGVCMSACRYVSLLLDMTRAA